MGLVGRVRKVGAGCSRGAVLLQISRLKKALLPDMLSLGGDADVDRPDAGKLASQGRAEGECLLVISLQRLVDRLDGKLQALVAMAEFGHQVLCTDIVSDTRGRRAAKVEHGGAQRELVGLAAHVPVSPGHSGAAAKVGGIRSIEAHRVQ